MNRTIETTQFHILTTHTCGKYVVHDTLTHTVSRREIFYKIANYGHRAQYLSSTQVAPGHVSEILTMNTEEVKSENPELKK